MTELYFIFYGKGKKFWFVLKTKNKVSSLTLYNIDIINCSFCSSLNFFFLCFDIGKHSKEN